MQVMLVLRHTECVDNTVTGGDLNARVNTVDGRVLAVDVNHAMRVDRRRACSFLRLSRQSPTPFPEFLLVATRVACLSLRVAFLSRTTPNSMRR